MEDSSVGISSIYCNVNRQEDAARVDILRRKKEVQQLIDDMPTDDDDEEEDEDESEDEEETNVEFENELDPASPCVSEQQETSMLNSNISEQYKIPNQETSYVGESRHTDACISNGQQSCLASNCEECVHSYYSHAQGSSEIPSEVEEDNRNTGLQMNGHCPLEASSFIDHHSHSRLQEESYIDSNLGGGAVSPVNIEELQEECRSLRVLYDSTFQELQQVKKSEFTCMTEAEQQKRIYESQIFLLNGEKEKLGCSLQATQALISDYKSQNKTLQSEVNSLKDQLEDVIEARNEALSKFESSEISVHSLEKQLREIHRSENLSRLHDQHDRILEELKMRHQEKVLQCKETIDKLQTELDLKTQDAESLAKKNCELQQMYVEKVEQFNNLSNQLDMVHKRHQQYLNTDTTEELNKLKLQVQQLEEENSKLIKLNEALKVDIKSLKAELDTSETLQKLAFFVKSNHNFPEASDGRQKELNLQSELEDSLKNVRTLRTENRDLKKVMKNNENELSQLFDKIKFYKSQISELENKCKELEEKLKYHSLNESIPITLNEKKIKLLEEELQKLKLNSQNKCKELEEKLKYHTSNECIPITLHEKKIKSLEEELQKLKMNSHDMTKKLKDCTRNEMSLMERNEDLQRKMKEMLQKHTKENIESIEECRKQCLELHQNVLSKEKERLESKAEQDLKNVCLTYENRIVFLQEENKNFVKELFEVKSECHTIRQDNDMLRKKLDQVDKSKEKREIDKEIRIEDEKQQQMEEHLLKKKAEYFQQLKVQFEQAQIEWTHKKMEQIKEFVNKTKQDLDEQFQNCLIKERNNLHHESETQLHKLEEEHKEKIKKLKLQYEQENHEQSMQLRQDLQSKLLKECNTLKKQQEEETKQIKHHYDSRLLEAEKNLKCLQGKLIENSKQQEVEKIKQEYALQQRLFEQEKVQFLSAENALNKNLNTLMDTEKRLREKLKKYQRHTCAIKKHHEEEIIKLQKQLSDLQKSCEEKQNQIHYLNTNHKQQMEEICEKFRKQQDSCETSEKQGKEEMLSEEIANMKSMFFKSLRNISDEIRQYLIQSKHRNADKLQESLQRYHQHKYTKFLQDLSKDLRSIPPHIILPLSAAKSTSSINSKETIETLTSSQDFQNGQFKTSTPGIFHSANKRFAPTAISSNKPCNPSRSSSSPNLHLQTKPKSLPKVDFCDKYKNCSSFKSSTPAVDAMSSGDAGIFPEKLSSSQNRHAVEKDLLNGKDVESVPGFEEVSYDFMLIDVPVGLYDPRKMPNHGLFKSDNNRKAVNFVEDSFPVKLLP